MVGTAREILSFAFCTCTRVFAPPYRTSSIVKQPDKARWAKVAESQLIQAVFAGRDAALPQHFQGFSSGA
jgi:hypothetical protein